ncbi:uncharacterized protein EV420DRAFT_1646422 [Desarmillaria tabescens]|uniref:Uncharacterized protein n=1 Tax=Armillaria tabescens TaxID=1929756 RepID=A0AA39JX23_ARMTA|nr:uncharacterized protein EV420DRAFT_1646422 [Desarmillaria tabescens]KAK0450501.1 hypothetical protein EV420DRAFT_1646422 [Desarmillaria tabescens]
MSAQYSSEAGGSEGVNSQPSRLRQVVVTKDDRVFVLLTTRELAPIPSRAIVDPSQSTSMRFPVDPTPFLERCWSINSIPYQAFVPVDTYAACSCCLLRCLNYTHASVPIESKGDRWYLRQDVFRDWKDLETVVLQLREVSRSATTDLRLGRALFSWPELSRYGYGRSHVDHLKLTAMLMCSREAFMLVLAEVAYNAVHQTDFWDEVVSSHFDAHVAGSNNFNVQGLQHVGLFVDVEDCDFTDVFEHMINAGIPLWLAWGSIQAWASATVGLLKYVPTGDELWQALCHPVEGQAAMRSTKRVPLGLRALPDGSIFDPSPPQPDP